MSKKMLVGIVLVLSLILSFTPCFAASEMKKASDNAKNMVSHTQNAIGNAAKSTGNVIKDGAQATGNAVKNGAQAVGNTVQGAANATGNALANGANYAKNTVKNMIDGNTDYTATRTSQEETFMGMSSDTWSWLILGVAAIAIIALVWYYSMQLNTNKSGYHNNKYDNDDYRE